ncbi:MAG: transposase [Fusobacteriaceae bacterium]
MIRDFLKQGQIKMPDDLNNLFKDMMKDVIEQCYNAEIEEELGYSKYDYRNEDSKNYCNGYTEKKH